MKNLPITIEEIKAHLSKLQKERENIRLSAQMRSISDGRFYTNGSNKHYQEEMARMDNLILEGYEQLAEARCKLNDEEV